MATVLVVDDESGIAEVLEAVLADEGHRVLTAANGRHGLALLAEEPADLIFLDYMMPVMNGGAMLSALAGAPSLQRIPVVLMSAMPEAVAAECCSGYARFLHKPFKIAQAIALAGELLEPDEGRGRLAG